jgi:allantoicase
MQYGVRLIDFTKLPDLASRRFGGSVVLATDEFFGAKEKLIKPEPPTFTPGTFGPKGQVYDGWETRRHRAPDHDYAIIRLGLPGVPHGVIVDTAYFTGNHPPEISVEGCEATGHQAGPDDLTGWFPLVPRSSVTGDAQMAFPLTVRRRVTHVRLCIYPDGGVARLRVHGEAMPDPLVFALGVLDLAALENGGLAVDTSDAFYGAPQNLLAPGPARTMGEGWETRRRRDAGHDWAVIRLAARGTIRLAEIDTTNFLGNAPDSAALHGTDANRQVTRLDSAAAGWDVGSPMVGYRGEELGETDWRELLPVTALQPDTRHRFLIDNPIPVTHVKVDVYPDGGLARLRLWGSPSA